jgi:DNA polymerase III alpha subunit (gram-positive type)
MIFNLRDVSHVSVKGFELELHFNDASSHMQRFNSVEEMLAAIESWRLKSVALDRSNPRSVVPRF